MDVVTKVRSRKFIIQVAPGDCECSPEETVEKNKQYFLNIQSKYYSLVLAEFRMEILKKVKGEQNVLPEILQPKVVGGANPFSGLFGKNNKGKNIDENSNFQENNPLNKRKNNEPGIQKNDKSMNQSKESSNKGQTLTSYFSSKKANKGNIIDLRIDRDLTDDPSLINSKDDEILNPDDDDADNSSKFGILGKEQEQKQQSYGDFGTTQTMGDDENLNFQENISNLGIPGKDIITPELQNNKILYQDDDEQISRERTPVITEKPKELEDIQSTTVKQVSDEGNFGVISEPKEVKEEVKNIHENPSISEKDDTTTVRERSNDIIPEPKEVKELGTENLKQKSIQPKTREQRTSSEFSISAIYHNDVKDNSQEKFGDVVKDHTTKREPSAEDKVYIDKIHNNREDDNQNGNITIQENPLINQQTNTTPVTNNQQTNTTPVTNNQQKNTTPVTNEQETKKDPIQAQEEKKPKEEYNPAGIAELVERKFGKNVNIEERRENIKEYPNILLQIADIRDTVGLNDIITAIMREFVYIYDDINEREKGEKSNFLKQILYNVELNKIAIFSFTNMARNFLAIHTDKKMKLLILFNLLQDSRAVNALFQFMKKSEYPSKKIVLEEAIYTTPAPHDIDINPLPVTFSGGFAKSDNSNRKTSKNRINKDETQQNRTTRKKEKERKIVGGLGLDDSLFNTFRCTSERVEYVLDNVTSSLTYKVFGIKRDNLAKYLLNIFSQIYKNPIIEGIHPVINLEFDYCVRNLIDRCYKGNFDLMNYMLIELMNDSEIRKLCLRAKANVEKKNKKPMALNSNSCNCSGDKKDDEPVMVTQTIALRTYYQLIMNEFMVLLGEIEDYTVPSG
jgi:hypothetical protein